MTLSNAVKLPIRLVLLGFFGCGDPGVGGLPGVDLRRERGPDTAHRHVGRPVVRLAHRSGLRVRHRAPHRPHPRPDAGRDLAALHRDRLLVRAPARAPRPLARARAARGRRVRRRVRRPWHGGDPVPARRRRAGQRAAAPADLRRGAGRHAARATGLLARTAHPPARASRGSPAPAPAGVHDRRSQSAPARRRSAQLDHPSKTL